jgi:SSS family solute:Na+ symporter
VPDHRRHCSSRYLYKLNILTLGDFYRMRYNRTVEVLTTICIVASYLGWVAAQIKALGLIFFVVTDGAVSQQAGMILGAAIVAHLHHLRRHVLGGHPRLRADGRCRWAACCSSPGSSAARWTAAARRSSPTPAQAGKLDFFPEMDPLKWIAFLGAWVTMMLGSIPQQDVFQRVTSAKSAKIALWGSVLGASIYFCFTFVPMFIAYSATLIDPEHVRQR